MAEFDQLNVKAWLMRRIQIALILRYAGFKRQIVNASLKRILHSRSTKRLTSTANVKIPKRDTNVRIEPLARPSIRYADIQ